MNALPGTAEDADLRDEDEAHQTKPHLTDSGNAERFARLARGRLIFSTAGRWYFWDGRRWRRDEQEIGALRCAKAVARLLHKELAKSRGEYRDQLFKHWRRSDDLQRQKAMIKLAVRETGMSIAAEEFDRDPWLLNVVDGTLDLRTGELRRHDPADRITRLTRIKFDPAAQCPRFDRFLIEVFGDDRELIDFIQRLVGYFLTGDTTVHGLFVLWGDGSNGKSTFVELLLELLGDYADALDAEVVLLSRQSSDNLTAANRASLFGRRLISMQETSKRRSLNEAFVKAATGGDKISA